MGAAGLREGPEARLSGAAEVRRARLRGQAPVEPAGTWGGKVVGEASPDGHSESQTEGSPSRENNAQVVFILNFCPLTITGGRV